MDDLRIVRVDVIQCEQDLVEHRLYLSLCHLFPLRFEPGNQVVKAPLKNEHRDFDILAGLESLCVYGTILP